jgi:hypothetical protein
MGKRFHFCGLRCDESLAVFARISRLSGDLGQKRDKRYGLAGTGFAGHLRKERSLEEMDLSGLIEDDPVGCRAGL